MPATKDRAGAATATNPESAHHPAQSLAPRSCDHAVQFYETDTFLAETVTHFVLDGLERGECVLLVTTPLHRAAIAARLENRGIEVAAAERSGQYQPIDAARILAQIMVGHRPDRTRFDETVGRLVRAARSKWRDVRAFGEMVALLVERDNTPAAIQLEDFWNDLVRKDPFPLFCAYPLRAFQHVQDGRRLLHLCQAHTRIIPGESSSCREAAKEPPLASIQPGTVARETACFDGRRNGGAVTPATRTNFDVLAAAAQLGVWNYDPVSRLLAISPECGAHLGFDAYEPIAGARALRMIHQEDRARVKRVLVHALRKRSAFATECRVVSPSRKVRWIAVIGRLIPEGTRHAMGVTVDITEQKCATEKIEETTLQRATQLRESLDELEAFSYSVSHDLRAPLRAMQVYARSILDDFGSDLDPQAVSHLFRIERTAVKLDTLVRDVLAYSRVAKSPLELTPLSLDDIVDELLAQQSENARRHIKVDFPLHRVIGHEACLVQCLGNLLTNALKFTEPGVPPEIHVWSEPAGPLVKVSVADRGLGIHPNHHGRVFQMFSRVYPEQRYEGTGIGLAIAKKAVTRMGGEIGFTSELGRGSTFWFTLRGAAAGS